MLRRYTVPIRIETRRHHFLGIRVRAVEGGTCHTAYAALLSRSTSGETQPRVKTPPSRPVS
jgi:hypothetical protein